MYVGIQLSLKIRESVIFTKEQQSGRICLIECGRESNSLKIINKALELIDQELEFDSKFQKHKCKQRLTKLHQMIIRRRRNRLNQIEKYEPIKTKFEKREKHREKRAERAANLELSIEKELLNRLKEGVYPKELQYYNVDQEEFEKALNQAEIEEEKEYEVDEDISDYDSEESEDEQEYERELVEADIDELDDIGTSFGFYVFRGL